MCARKGNSVLQWSQFHHVPAQKVFFFLFFFLQCLASIRSSASHRHKAKTPPRFFFFSHIRHRSTQVLKEGSTYRQRIQWEPSDVQCHHQKGNRTRSLPGSRWHLSYLRKPKCMVLKRLNGLELPIVLGRRRSRDLGAFFSSPSRTRTLALDILGQGET